MSDNQQKQNKSSAIDALLMVALVFSLFTMLCIVTRSAILGEFGNVYSNFVLGAMGFSSYAIMPVIAVYSIFQLFGKKSANSLIILLAIALYTLGLSLIFHVLTSSSAEVFAGKMEYAEYINESYFLRAGGAFGSTAGGAICSAILYYIIQSVGIVGANIFSVLIIALATCGLWLVIRKQMPQKVKVPKVKKAKKAPKNEEIEEAEYPEYDPREEEEYFKEQAEPKKRYNLLDMEVINPSVREEHQYEEESQYGEQKTFRPQEKVSKMHVVNIDTPVQPLGKKGKKASAQDILFNGRSTEDKTIASYNRVRSLGGEEAEEFENSSLSVGNDQLLDILAGLKPSGGSITRGGSNDYQIKSTSEFGLFGETPKQVQAQSPSQDYVMQLPKDNDEITKAMYDKTIPANPPKIWTMADIENEKAEKANETLENEENFEEILTPEEIIQNQLSEEERREQLKADLLTPAETVDIENMNKIYPMHTKEQTEFVRPRIITSLEDLESEEEKEEEREEEHIISGMNRQDCVYDVQTDEFFDTSEEEEDEEIAEINSYYPPTVEVKQAQEEIIQDSVVDYGKTEFTAPSKTEFIAPEPEEIYSRHNISNPIVITNPDGKAGEQLPIYTEEKTTFTRPYIYPPVDLLEDFTIDQEVDMEDVLKNAEVLERVLENFNIPAKVMDMIVGPTVTKYELEMPVGIQVKRVENYSKDISMALESPSEVIIEAPIPGKNRVGIEVPNKIKQTVSLKEVVASSEFTLAKSKTVFALGKDVTGKNILCDIKDMPHLLIAGATGMGKSVCLNTLIMSLIYHADPSDLRMLLIDPKKVEFISYKGIPHLLINEIISDNDKAILALQWAIDEMEKRYTMFESVRQKDMDSYNQTIATKGGRKLPRIVIVVDEVADLMSVNKKEIEGKIQRLTQKARAAGIHLVLATQRPSVDVITGVIKTNLPSRIAFKLSNGIDSKTVIDEGGAEKLLGRGDMFYRPASWPAKVRVQGCFVSTPEVDKVIDFVNEHNTSVYDEACYNAIFNANKKVDNFDANGDDQIVDEYFKRAVHLAIEQNNITITSIQRRFSLGFPRAGKILDAMLSRGYVADTMNGKTREVLLDREGYEREFGEQF